MNKAEVEQLKKQLEAEYAADVAAVDRVLTLLSKGNQPQNGSSRVETLEARVGKAIGNLPNQFTLAEMMTKLSELYPEVQVNRASVSSIIYRLKVNHKLTVIKEGRGRRAAIYGKP